MREFFGLLRGTAVTRLAAVVPLVAVLGLGTAGAASANHHAKHHAKHHARHHRKHHAKPKKKKKHGLSLRSHGQRLHIVALRGNTTQSNNWFGYNKGALESASPTLFNSITGDWTVPTATQHTSGQAAASSDWIGIGGGCVNSGCTVTDSTLIQTGTEQDVASNGAPSYSAWWELVPAPSITIPNMTVGPGDHMHAAIAEVVNNADLWTITLQDVTRNETFSTTVPYTSSHLSAEWIEETPLEIGTNAGFSALPSLSNPNFDTGTVNGGPANLNSSESMQLIDSNGNVIGTPSGPDSDADGFGACTWSGTCTAPAS